MSAHEGALSFHATGQSRGLKPLGAVMAWELRRLRANRTNGLLAAVAFLIFLAILAVRNEWGLVGDTYLLGTTTQGQLGELVYDLMLLLGVMLPFLVTDIIAHDFKQRTHELLMTTAMPTWAYVWGRYLAGLVISLGLAIILLAAQLGANFVLPLLDRVYPVADPLVTLTFWFTIVLPAVVLVSGVCFSLGAFFPRYTVVAKVAGCMAWVILVLDLDPRDVGWRNYWNPTGAGLVTHVTDALRQAVQNSIPATATKTVQLQLALQLQQAMPDLRPWLGPYLALAGLGLLLVALAALAFRRFRDCLG